MTKRISGNQSTTYFAVKGTLNEMVGTLSLLVDVVEGKDDGDVSECLTLLSLLQKDLSNQIPALREAFKNE